MWHKLRHQGKYQQFPYTGFMPMKTILHNILSRTTLAIEPPTMALKIVWKLIANTN
jgi:hypothetical protein